MPNESLYPSQFRLRAGMHAELKALAERTDVPLVAIVRAALQDALDNAAEVNEVITEREEDADRAEAWESAGRIIENEKRKDGMKS